MTDSVEVAITSESNGQLWSVSVWDIITGSQLMVYKGGGVCGSHALSLAGTDYIIAAEVDKPLLHVWPINSSEPSHELRTVCPGIIGALAVSPNGKYIVAGIAEKVHVWQTEAGKLMCVAARHFQPITCIRFLEDSSHFVTGGEDGLVSVWQISMLTSTSTDCVQTVYSFSDNYLAVRDIYVGNGGSRTRIVSVSLDGSCRVYEFASGKLLLSVILDGYHLTAVTASVLESSLFLGSSSGDILTISLQESPRTLEHHLTDLEKESVFKGHCGTITSLSTSQDAITLLSSSVDETVRFWHIESKQCLRIIQHKGAVHNAFITYIPSQMFTEKLKPRLVMHRLQRASNLMENPDFNLEMMTSRDLVYVPYGNFGERNFVSEEMFQEELASISSEEVAEKSKEIEDLKKRNLELFEYAANKIFETHVENGVPRTDVVPSLININVALQQVETASLDIQPVYKLSKKVKKGRKQVAT